MIPHMETGEPLTKFAEPLNWENHVFVAPNNFKPDKVVEMKATFLTEYAYQRNYSETHMSNEVMYHGTKIVRITDLQGNLHITRSKMYSFPIQTGKTG